MEKEKKMDGNYNISRCRSVGLGKCVNLNMGIRVAEKG